MSSSANLDLPREDLSLVLGILHAHVPGRPVYDFGSRVTGRARRRSDLDLAIGGDTPLGWSLKGELLEAFDVSDLPIRVDVLDLAEATGIFRKRIESEWMPIQVAAKQLASRAA